MPKQILWLRTLIRWKYSEKFSRVVCFDLLCHSISTLPKSDACWVFEYSNLCVFMVRSVIASEFIWTNLVISLAILIQLSKFTFSTVGIWSEATANISAVCRHFHHNYSFVCIWCLLEHFLSTTSGQNAMFNPFFQYINFINIFFFFSIFLWTNSYPTNLLSFVSVQRSLRWLWQGPQTFRYSTVFFCVWT